MGSAFVRHLSCQLIAQHSDDRMVARGILLSRLAFQVAYLANSRGEMCCSRLDLHFHEIHGSTQLLKPVLKSFFALFLLCTLSASRVNLHVEIDHSCIKEYLRTMQ